MLDKGVARINQNWKIQIQKGLELGRKGFMLDP